MYYLQLVFSRCLAAGYITGVPGSIGQAADSPSAAVDRDLIGTDLAVGAVHIDIAGADRTVIAVDSDFIGTAADLNDIIQFQFVMVAAVSVSAFSIRILLSTASIVVCLAASSTASLALSWIAFSWSSVAAWPET